MPSESCPRTRPQVGHDKVRKRSRKARQPSLHITDADVALLLGCVSCEARWTVRKGSAQKISHMKACAQKRGIDLCTLKSLVEKDLAKARQTRAKGNTTTCTDIGPQTYLEAIVAEDRPRKRQKRADVDSTLQPIGQTKSAILDKAKALLGTSAAPSSAPDNTQGFGRSKLASELAHDDENVGPLGVQCFPGECSLTSRLALLRSMADRP
ncbi:hypothetical protein BC834DRAFT_689650 [Gloeopeniophorella convolvens]|nr:hypothetical protein BC834DRAFT_689650 [Gloeopeniophorella convolvens]